MPKIRQRTEKELENPIYKWRMEKKWTLEYMSKQLEVSRQLLNCWENGYCLPNSINAYKLYKLTGISIYDIDKWKSGGS